MKAKTPIVLIGTYLFLLLPAVGAAQDAEKYRFKFSNPPILPEQRVKAIELRKQNPVRVTYPLKLRMRGRRVVDLQEALIILFEAGLFLARDRDMGSALMGAILSEKERQYYGRYTKRAVSIFQLEQGLGPTGEVDRATAEAINTLLGKVGQKLETETKRKMNRIVYPLKVRMRGRKVADLQDALLVLLERKPKLFGLGSIESKMFRKQIKSERQRLYYGRTTKEAVSSLQRTLRLNPTGNVDKDTAEAINEALRKLGLL